MIEPVDPFECGEFDVCHGFPRAAFPDDFGFVEAVDGFSGGVVT